MVVSWYHTSSPCGHHQVINRTKGRYLVALPPNQGGGGHLATWCHDGIVWEYLGDYRVSWHDTPTTVHPYIHISQFRIMCLIWVCVATFKLFFLLFENKRWKSQGMQQTSPWQCWVYKFTSFENNWLNWPPPPSVGHDTKTNHKKKN